MATNRQRSLPTLRITAEQLRERAADVSRRYYASREKSKSRSTGYGVGEFGEGYRNEYLRGSSFTSSPIRAQSYKDMQSQLMPTPPRPASSGNLKGIPVASEDSYTVSRTVRGRGRKRRSPTKAGSHSRSSSMNDDMYVGRQQKHLTDDKNSANTGVKGRLSTDEEDARDDMVTAWKKYCSGRIERLIASWSQSGTASKLLVLLDTVWVVWHLWSIVD